uniref:Chromo domain-containing protein n=1 Tax=Romanomermis culicivorax TaxID=13658 RepID=A0A915K6N1_ROMCU
MLVFEMTTGEPFLLNFQQKAKEDKKKYMRKYEQKYKNEKVLKTKPLPDGQNRILVKWWGYPEEFNSWSLEKDIQNEDEDEN